MPGASLPLAVAGHDGATPTLQQYVVYLAFALILAVFAVMLRNDGFLSTANLLNIGRQAAPIAVMAVGMTFALAAAEIDLSVGSVVALSSLVAAEVVTAAGFLAGALAALGVGVAAGLVNGVISVKVRIPSFLVTLGMLGVISGIARNMNNLQSHPIRNDTFSAVFGAGSAGPVSSLLIWTVVALVVGPRGAAPPALGAPRAGDRRQPGGRQRPGHPHRPGPHRRPGHQRHRGGLRRRAAGRAAGHRAPRPRRERPAHRDRRRRDRRDQPVRRSGIGGGGPWSAPPSWRC